MNNSTYIAEISYQIEKWLYQGKTNKEISDKIRELQNHGEFPSNLVFVDAYLDGYGGTSGCAFLDTNTGETIVGFAGTNLDNGLIESTKDVVTDIVGIGVSGISPNSPYMSKANEFIDDLQKKGYNITQTTGHSLGGNLCVLVGLKYNIPLIVTYNGAPLYGLSIAELTGVAPEIRKLYKNYDGRIIRFVSDKDWLNSNVDLIGGFYYGEEYMLYNGQGHDIKYFKKSNEQEFIKRILQTTLNKYGSLSVDIDGDNNIDINLKEEDLYVKNLFGVNGLYGGNGTDIKIDPQAFYNLQQNLKNRMVEEDFSWIKDTIVKCNEKNEALKESKEIREDILVQKVVEGLNEAQLLRVLSGIEESHGKLLDYKNIIFTLSNFDTYNVTRKFDMWGNSGGRRWFLDGVEFDEYELIGWIEDLKKAAGILYHQITSTGEFEYFNQETYTYEVYRYDTLSKIGEAYVLVTNTFLSKANEVFKGTGLRSGKNDGIVNSISEVLEFELKNSEEMKKKVENLSNMAGSFGDNFSKIDAWIKDRINEGEGINSFSNETIEKEYKAYLQENKILDDVKDVLEAYDLQVEEATNKLSNSIVSDYTDLINRSHTKLSTIYSYFETFIKAVDYLQGKINGQVTSIRIKTEMVEYNQWESTEIKEYHGALSQSFPSEVVTAIGSAKRDVNPILPNFTTVVSYIGMFNTQINQIKEYFNIIIEEAVYNSMELDTIINAQMLISLRIKRMRQEIIQVKLEIEEQFSAIMLNDYQEMLDELIKLYEYFDLMINDCFGTNSK